MLGISVYLSKENERFNEEWIENASQQGFTSIFTSLHIPEEDPSAYKELLYKVAQAAKRSKMDLNVDISPKSLSYLNLKTSETENLLEWGITGLRVDYGFSIEEIVQLSNKMKVSLNASTLTQSFLEELIDKGLNINNAEAAHNFYPRPETGLSKEYFIGKNKFLKKYGIKVSAFIPGDGIKRQPLFCGLPTLEEHRNQDLIYSYLELTLDCNVDFVYIGDISLSEETLRRFAIIKDSKIPIRYSGKINEFEEIYNYLLQPRSNRLDPSAKVIRLADSRTDLQKEIDLKPNHCVERVTGSITIDNELYGRYSGEIHITLEDLPLDPKVNVIGYVIEEDIPLLKFVRGGTTILLQKVTKISSI